MVNRDELTNYLNIYLKTTDYPDTSWNGLQVEGKPEVNRIVVAVTAGQELFDRAAEEEVDFIITHHGHFWSPGNPSLTGYRKKRLQTLLQHDISFYVSHLPLDAHPEVGNNAQLLQLIGAKIKDDFHISEGKPISFSGQIPKGRHLDDITKVLNEQLPTNCLVLNQGPAIIQSVAVCTGGGGYKAFYEALDLGVDLYISGDTAEIYHDAKDAKMNVIFAGHHATETLGVKALGQHLAEKFNLPVAFIDLPTGL